MIAHLSQVLEKLFNEPVSKVRQRFAQAADSNLPR
jgi:hypothetical protein